MNILQSAGGFRALSQAFLRVRLGMLGMLLPGTCSVTDTIRAPLYCTVLE